ncbi:MAG: excinuclease ABC subunit A [Pseudomonadota bacterium]
MSLDARQSCLKAACLFVIGFGLFCLTATMTGTAGVARVFTDLAFWPLDGAPLTPSTDAGLLWGILGGCLVGWGLLLWQVVTRLYLREPGLARRMIAISIMSWFLIDGIGSTLAGAPMNVVLNLFFLVIFIAPLIGQQKAAAAA